MALPEVERLSEAAEASVALPEVEAEPSVVTAADPSQGAVELLLVALLPQEA
jgi:hypothetical protein